MEEKMDDDKNKNSEDNFLELKDLSTLVPKTTNWEDRMKLKRSWSSTGNEALGPSAIKYNCRNVTTFLLINQLGPKEFVSISPITTSLVMNPKVLRTLTAWRTGSSSFTRISSLSPPIKPFQLDLPGLSGDPNNTNNQLINDGHRTDDNWAWITNDVLGTVRLETAGSLLWSCCLKPGEPENSKQCLLQFYSFSPGTFEFKIVSSYTIAERILKWEILEYQHPHTQQTFKFFILLNQAKQLLAYDLKKNVKTDDLILVEDKAPNDEESDSEEENQQTFPTKTCFKTFEVCHETQQLLLLKTDKYANLHTIVIFSFPPKWTTVDILHVGHLKLQLFLHKGYCFSARHRKTIMTSSWAKLYAQAYPQRYSLRGSADPSNKSPCPDSLTVSQILRIDKLPTTATIITPTIQTPKFGMLDIKPPMLHIKFNNDIHFYRLDLSSTLSSTSWNLKMDKSSFEETNPIYKCHAVTFGMDDYRHNIKEFPDKTPKFLLTNPKLSNHVVVTIVKDPKTGKIRGIKSYPFAYVNDKVGNSLAGGENKSATTLSVAHPKQCVLEMDYCKSLNMLAVLFGIGDSFAVQMYEPDTLELLHTMPIVQRLQTAHLGTDRVVAPSIVFQPEFLLVELFFKDFNDDMLRDVFVGRLFVEDLK